MQECRCRCNVFGLLDRNGEVILLMKIGQEKENIILVMGIFMKVILLMEIEQERENIILVMGVSMKVILLMELFQEKKNYEGNIDGIFRMTTTLIIKSAACN